MLRPKPDIILFGSEDGTAELAEEVKARHVPDVSCSPSGTPLVNSLFECAEAFSANDVLAYVNADIILLGDFLSAVSSIKLKKFLMVGRRLDLDVDALLDLSTPDWEGKLRSRLPEATLHPPTGADYFVFSRGLFCHMPAFAIGRPGWDNWAIYRARSRRVAVIDTTEVVTAVHQNHDYNHVAGGADEVWGGQEAIRNKELAGHESKIFTLLDANWALTSTGLSRPTGKEYRQRSRLTFLVLHPPLYSMARILHLPVKVIRKALKDRASVV